MKLAISWNLFKLMAIDGIDGNEAAENIKMGHWPEMSGSTGHQSSLTSCADNGRSAGDTDSLWEGALSSSWTQNSSARSRRP